MSGGKGGDSPGVPNLSATQNQSSLGTNVALGTVGYGQTLKDIVLPKFTDEIFPYVQNFMGEQEQSAHTATDFAKRISDTYADAYNPLNYEFVKSLTDTFGADKFPVYSAQVAGQAAADQYAAGNAALRKSIDQLMAYGVDPSSQRFGTALTTANLLTAGNAAFAASAARRQALQDKLNALGTGVQIGGALPTQFANLTSTGTQARAAGVAGGNQTMDTFGRVVGTPLGALDTATRALGGASSAITGAGQLANESARINATADQGFGSLVGGVLGTGAKLLTTPLAGTALAAISDRRLKTDIERVGQLDNGLPVYRFRYIGGTELRLGLMADEVEQVVPEAVYEMPSGYKAVDYDRATRS